MLFDTWFNTNVIEVPSDSKNAKWTRYVSKMPEIPDELRNIFCAVAVWKHAVFVTKCCHIFAGGNKKLITGSEN